MSERGEASRTPVAIVGMAAFFPGSRDLAGYWRTIVDGVDAITEVPAGRWDAEFYAPDGPRRADRMYCRRGGFVDADAEFDLARFGIMPASVPGTEPDQLIALHVAHESLADAGGDAALPADRQRVGVVLGRGGYLTPGLVRLDQRVRTANQLTRTLRELLPELPEERVEAVRAAFAERLGPERPESAIGLVPNLAASRVANRLDLRGPAYTVDAACASALVAVDHAVRELDAGRCDLVLAGGVHHCHDITLWSVFSQLGALSPSERIRPLDRGADGVLIGEGTGVVVLKRLADAERDGDRIYAVVAGTGVASDGRGASLLNPDPAGQLRAVRQAWDAAGLDPRAPDAIGLLEAHGTATPAGDRAELATVAEAFGPGGRGASRAAIGSVKSMIGHTMPAAGIAGMIKTALALHHGVLPPTLHCEDPSPALEATRFAPLAAARPWQGPERAGVNAFGFGGINAHVVLERPASAARPARRHAVTVTEPERVLRLAAPDPAGLAALLDRPDAEVLAASRDERELVGADEPARLGIVDPTPRRLTLGRKAVARGAAWRGRGEVWFSPRPLLGPAGGGLTAFVFPGLEAEFDPRVAELAAHFGLPWSAGGDARVGDVGRHGTAVFELGRLLDTALRRVGVRPDAVAGHSVGEWTAMACGGFHSPEEVDAFLADFDPDALRVPGAVFAVLGMPADQVTAELAGREDVVLSHDNAPNQSMVCGPQDAVGDLVARMRERGVISQVLPFRSGFHTPMLAPYLDPIRRAAEGYTLHRPTVPVWSATTAAPYPEDADAVRELFVRHLLEPVRFRLMISAMYEAGHRAFVQLGAGQLGSLIGDTLSGREHLVVSAHAGTRDSLAQLRRVVTALWVDGAEPDAAPLLASGGRRAEPRRPRLPVRLDLDGALVSLPETARVAAVGGSAATAPAGGVGATGVRPHPARAFPARGAPAWAPAAAAPHDTRGPAGPPAPAPGRTAHPARVPATGAAATGDRDTVSGALADGTSTAAHAPPAADGRAPRPATPAQAGAAHPPAGPTTATDMDTDTAATTRGPAHHPASAVGAPNAPHPATVQGHRGGTVAPAEGSHPAGVGVGRAHAGPGGSPGAVGPVRGDAAAALARLAQAAGGHPVAAELSALLSDTAAVAAELIGAAAKAGPAARPRPAAPPPPALRVPGPPPSVLRVDVAAMPYLLDHCFFRQRPGWPDDADRWPVVPATTVIAHLMEIAERAAHGLRAVALREVRLLKWIAAMPAVDVPVTVARPAPDRVEVSLNGSARAVVEMAPGYAAPPAPWRFDPAGERVPEMTADRLYGERWMFHGPRFQGVSELTAIGERHVRGVITAPEAPGALLDNAGQLLGYWIMATLTERTTVFPMRMDRIRFHGPHPRPGARVACLVRITGVTDETLVADVQLVHSGRVWAEITGWADRRFDTDPGIRKVDRYPGAHTLSARHPEGWTVVHERWPDLATRELIMRNMLGGGERAAYEALPPVRRRQWLLGRIAAKDAVRDLLWRENGREDIYPAELAVGNDEAGRPFVRGVHGRRTGELTVSIAHRAEAGVAIARRGGGPCGIDIEEIADRPRATLRAACGAGELALLDRLAAGNGGGGQDTGLWFTRFWAAKEAVAKARGTGLRGRPADYRVADAPPHERGGALRVAVGNESYLVRLRQVANPPTLPERRYVVAWTASEREEEERRHDY
ncbi:beta-ketoacyl synthase N-terminal-like domain-containing protein [Streptomyces sp. 6N223]|uniref:beta-ketoacyl synthase N-terminal-like domain-containing protein n=1 Tax=Streptomyces sp. 6N223 TaxID=3457412 RepID=UPI003FCF4871